MAKSGMKKSVDGTREPARRGPALPRPAAIFMYPSVDPKAVAQSAVIHPGCRIAGAETSIGPGCVLGEDGPVTLEDCQLGEGVVLKSGVFRGATFLSGASFGPNGQARPDTLMEEQASAAHAVGLKQTLLMPFVTIGSMVNFCDILMAGGADRTNHSEVGSSYVHFNFTPRRDKATASLLGDIPRGVMLDQAPIFLGGQGGIVGPVRVEFGAVLAAGIVCRRDVTRPGRLVFGEPGRHVRERPYEPDRHGDLSRVIAANLAYVGNLRALSRWYTHARSLFVRANPFDRACHKGALRRIEGMIRERVSRMNQLAAMMADAARPVRRREDAAAAFRREFARRWPAVEQAIARTEREASSRARDAFLAALDRERGSMGYLEAIRALGTETKRTGSAWLKSVVDSVTGLW